MDRRQAETASAPAAKAGPLALGYVRGAMPDVLDELLDLLRLDPVEPRVFRGRSQDLGWGTVFGGQVLGQALSAAARTVPGGRAVHSLHAYFLRTGDARRPILYEVDAIRDGASFATRRVVAVQGAHAIFSCAASFQIEEPGLEHAAGMPDVPGPDGLPSELDLARAHAARIPEPLRAMALADRPIEIRPVQPYDILAPRVAPPRRQLWFRATGTLPDDPAVHRYLLAYASDFNFLVTAMLPHGVSWLTPGMQVASLDHAMWFHRPFRMDDWLLYDVESPTAREGPSGAPPRGPAAAGPSVEPAGARTVGYVPPMLPSTLLVQAALAADASGYLDAADGTHIAGWASDPEYAGPVQVHVYVDDVLVKALEASSYRADVGAHAFDWTHEPFGAGSHSVTVYAIGVDASGAPDGRNMALYGARSFEVGCAGLSGDPLAWCEGNPGYWEDRQADTEYVGNSLVRAGVNPSYGGTVFQLFDDDWERNLLMEHGGAAIQLSIWGYDPVGGTGWFGDSWCDSTPYASEASCLAAGHASCVARAYSAGDHVADCDRVEPCVGWNAGAPYNPIQAQGSACAWDNAANDAASTWAGSELRTSLSTPRHFTKDGAGVSGLTFGQAVTAGDAWIVLEQRIAYTGSQTWCDHDQETPAFFTAQDVDARFYWYEGDAPYADASSAVRTLDAPQNGVLLFPGVTSPTTLPAAGEASERWWGVCDASEDRCVTIASFEASLVHASLAATPGRGAYLTPMGHWNLYPGFDETFTTYVFPYRHDTVVAGRSVRDWIHTLAAENGCSAEIDCNGIDEDCTGADRCAPADTGGGDDDGDGGTDTGASGGGDTGEAPDSGAPDDGEADADDAADDDDPGVPGRARVLDEGCGCVGGGLPSAAFLVPALLVALRVRRAPSVLGGRLRGRVGGG